MTFKYEIILKHTARNNYHTKRNKVIRNSPLFGTVRQPKTSYKPDLKCWVNPVARKLVAKLRRHKIAFKAEIAKYTPVEIRWNRHINRYDTTYLLTITGR